MARRAVIVAGVRTPFVKAGDRFRDVPAEEMGRAASRELLVRSGLNPADVDEVIFGCVAQPSNAANVARVIGLRAGVPRETPAVTVGRNCGSGMEAVTLAAERVLSGRADVILAGGVESMSRIPLQYPLSFSWKMGSMMRARSFGQKVAATLAFRMRDLKPVIAIQEGLTDPVSGDIMGLTAERLARDFGITRKQQDEYALQSHQRASRSREFLAGEIASLGVAPRFYDIVEEDVGPREEQSMEALGKMRPYFDRRHGSVTIANSCQVTDGAVALLIMEEDRAKAEGFTPIARIAGFAYHGCEPKRMGLGPVYATPPALAEAGIPFSELSRFEVNEAFAAQVMACERAFSSSTFAEQAGFSGPIGEIDPEKLNAHGGAIALGHPVGATGTRLVLTLMRQLQQDGGGFGLAALCIGGGQGGAVVLEGMAA